MGVARALVIDEHGQAQRFELDHGKD